MNAQEIRGHWDQIRGKVKEKWGQLTDDDLRLASGNLDQLIGRIEQKTGQARRDVEKFLDELVASDSPLMRVKEAAVGYGQAAMDTARESLDQISGQAREKYQRAGEVVQHHPAESMAVVFGMGFLTGLVLGVLLSSES